MPVRNAECRQRCEAMRTTGEAENQDLLSNAAAREWAESGITLLENSPLCGRLAG
jgi:hypothetical protein